jgi:hypothetical protein
MLPAASGGNAFLEKKFCSHLLPYKEAQHASLPAITEGRRSSALRTANDHTMSACNGTQCVIRRYHALFTQTRSFTHLKQVAGSIQT